ncbi:MAG: hypothetical protein KDD25_04255, partial [Bdellovibrionales bacterium]|nr:hypothetical protein [Bdellovibrionales bacterium]
MSFWAAVIALFGMSLAKASEPATPGHLEKAKENLDQTETERRNVLADLYHIKRKMKAIEKERGILDQKKSNIESSIRNLTGIVGGVENRIASQKENILKRLREIYKFGGRGVMRLSFSSLNSIRLDRNLRILKNLTQKDRQAIEQYAENLDVLKDRKSELVRKSKSFEEVKDELNLKSAELEKEIQKRNKIIGQLDTKRVLQIAELKRARLEKRKDLASNEKKNLSALNEILLPAIFEKKGQLPWPVESANVLVPYGRIKVEP